MTGPSPYASPDPLEPSSTAHPRDHSVHAEPWMRGQSFTPDPTDSPGSPQLWPSSGADELVENSVWDEPVASIELTGGPDASSVTWFRFYQTMVSSTSDAFSWAVTLAVAVASGPAAIVGTLWTGSGSYSGLVMATILGPTIEEILKIALPLWIIEKKPWLYHSSGQVLVCGIASGLAFAAVENAIYLNLYISNPSPALVAWRWSVCVLLHTACSLIAAIGVVAIRRSMIARQAMPQLVDGGRWITAAIVIHGTYNAAAWFLNDHL